MKFRGRKVAHSARNIHAEDFIHVRGEVETFAYFPEYKAQIDHILRTGKGSPKDNWMPDGDWNWQRMMNTVVDGKKIAAATLGYPITEGLDAAQPDKAYTVTDPNKYINRPGGIQIKDNSAGHYYSRWFRGDDERMGVVCNEGEEYVRFITEIPAIDPHTSFTAWFNTGGQTLSVEEIQLRGPAGVRALVNAGGTGILGVGGIAPFNVLRTWTGYPIAYPLSLVVTDPTNTYYQHRGWPDDYYIYTDPAGEPERQLIHMYANAGGPQGVFTFAYLDWNLTLDTALGHIFSSLLLTNPIPKTSAFALAIVWKILFS